MCFRTFRFPLLSVQKLFAAGVETCDVQTFRRATSLNLNMEITIPNRSRLIIVR